MAPCALRSLAKIGFRSRVYGHHDFSETFFQILQTGSEAEDGHDFGCDGDIETVRTRKTVCRTAETDGDVTQGTVVHVDDAFPDDTTRIDTQFVAMMDMIVDQCGQQVVGHGDSTDIAGEMEIDVFHRDDLRITAAGSTAFHAEDRSHGGFTKTDNGLFANAIERVPQTDRGRGLAFAGGRRIDGGDHNQFAIRFVLQSVEEIQ